MHYINICHSKNSIQTPSKICFRHKSIHNFDVTYNTLGGKNVTIHLQIQELTYGMHKIVKRCNLEEEEEEELDKKEVIFVSATAAAATHEVVMITVKIIERNLTA